MKNKILGSVISLLLVGCASNPNAPAHPISESMLKLQTYTYTDLNGTRSDLWKKALNYMATTYGDSKAVLRVEDELEGVLIGKGLVRWQKYDSFLSPNCLSEYDIRFIAKNNKARLQLELLRGVPAASECNWALPSNYGYKQILSQFSNISGNLKSALHGEGKLESMQDF